MFLSDRGKFTIINPKLINPNNERKRLSSEQFYGNFRERGAKKAFRSELFDSITAEFKEGLENAKFKEKNQKTLRQKRKKSNWWSRSKRFLEKPCNI